MEYTVEIENEKDKPEVGFGSLQQTSGGQVEVAKTAAAQKEMMMVMAAKQFPRDQDKAFQAIMRSCKRRSFAEQSQYSFPRGGQEVSGLSIRAAEEFARNWGNLDCGIVEIEAKPGESTMMAYAWDMETNTRTQKVFQVKHLRTKNDRRTREKITTQLDDPRDIYEMNANQGSRRLRACILALIPGDILEAAKAQCDQTLAGNSQEPVQDRAKKMLAAFDRFGVTKEMIEEKQGKAFAAISEKDLVSLGKIFNSLKDGMSQVADWFYVAPKAAGKDANEALKNAKKPAKEEAPKPEPKDNPDPFKPTPEELANYEKGLADA